MSGRAGGAARAFAALALVALALGACAHAPGKGGEGRLLASASPAPADDSTLVLYRFDETGGARLADSGPQRLDARAGVDTRTEFGRIRNGRRFTRSIDSFVYLPYRETLEARAGLTAEAWVYVSTYGQYEATPIVGRWTEAAGEQSWLFGVLGLDIRPPLASLPGPDFLRIQGVLGVEGKLFFLYQPEEAGSPHVYFSSETLPLERWTHVAVTFDGELVRFYVGGQLDAQYAVRGRIRPSRAPLLVGNYFNWRSLTDFGGELRFDPNRDANPYYAFDGVLDDLRLSLTARREFPHARYAWEKAPAAP